MNEVWFDALRTPCNRARGEARCRYPTDVVLFYLARWCQKQARSLEPPLAFLDEQALREPAERIARNLTVDGPRVDRLNADPGQPEAWTELRRELLASAARRAGAAAADCADEALQKIALVLLTGTSPSRAAERLRLGPDGPTNEYVFDSPFSGWARTVVINLIKDRWREERGPAQRDTRGEALFRLDRKLVDDARAALPGLLQAIRELPAKQQSVMVLSLARRDIDEVVRERLHELASDLFSVTEGELVSSDRDIARRLGSTARRVAANRSAARRKLARREPLWGLLLDVLLPHRSTVPADVDSEA